MFHQKPLLGQQINWAHPLAKGLVGCWVMNEGSGNRVNDYSGQGHYGTIDGAIWIPNLLRFDGIDDIISYASVTQEYISIVTKTIKYGAGDSTGPRLVESPGYVAFIGGWGGEGDDNIIFTSLRATQNGSWKTPIDSFPEDIRHSTGITYDSTSTSNIPKMYLKGVPQSVAQLSGAFNPIGAQNDNAGTGYIGGRADKARQYHGDFEYLYIYDIILTPQKIAQLHRDPYCFIEPMFDLELWYVAAAAGTVPVFWHHLNKNIGR